MNTTIAKSDCSSDSSEENIREMLSIYRNMVKEVDRLESMFSNRHFTLDGHLIGSIGEAIAANSYGISLEKPSYKGFDGTVSGVPVQIKIVQQDRVMLRYDGADEDLGNAYLLVLYMNKDGNYFEVYNGQFNLPWSLKRTTNKSGYKQISINQLMKLRDECRLVSIPQVKKVELMKPEFKNT